MEKPSPLLNLPLKLLDPALIQADPATYQFRRTDDAQGVTKTHRIEGKQWDSVLLGDPLLVHERKDGTLFVADGHHRLAFAKQLKVEGKPAPETLAAYVLREADGFSAEDVKIIAAFKNIQQDSKNVAETARVFKEAASGKVHQELLPSLQIDKGNLRLAYSLSGLSEKSLDKIERGEVPVDAAQLVVQQVSGEAMQDQVMDIIGHKLKQAYPAPNPFTSLAGELAGKANYNHNAGAFLQRELARREAKNKAIGLGAA